MEVPREGGREGRDHRKMTGIRVRQFKEINRDASRRLPSPTSEGGWRGSTREAADKMTKPETPSSLILITRRSAGCLIRDAYAMLIIPANSVIMQFFINPAMYKLGIEM